MGNQSVFEKSRTQQVRPSIRADGGPIVQRDTTNLISGAGVTITVEDNRETQQVDVTVTVASASGDKNYVHIQTTPSASWTVLHNLGKYPSVTIVTSGGDYVIGSVAYNSINQCTLTFAAGFSGKAFCN